MQNVVHAFPLTAGKVFASAAGVPDPERLLKLNTTANNRAHAKTAVLM
jgi:hypothetical protein